MLEIVNTGIETTLSESAACFKKITQKINLN